MAELSTLPATGPDSPPPHVTAGPYCLRRRPADWPEELAYVGDVDAHHTVWLKSSNLLEGPWEWVIQAGGETIDFSARRFDTRAEAVADLLPALAPLVGPPAEDDAAAVVVEAAPAAPAVASDADPDVLAAALDIAIRTLQKARAAFPATGGAARSR